MRAPLPKMFVATIISGLFSGVTLLFGPIGIITVYFGPGLFFGLATGFVLVSAKKIDPRRMLLWVIACTAAWYIALEIFIIFASRSINPSVSIPAAADGTAVAGIVGSAILALVFSLLVHRVRLAKIFLTVAIGGITAIFIIAIPNGEVPGPEIILSFLMWQVSVGASLLI